MEPLVEQTGGIAIQWYEKGLDPTEKFKNHKLRNRGNAANFTVPADEFIDHVMFALGEWSPSAHHLANLYDKSIREVRN